MRRVRMVKHVSVGVLVCLLVAVGALFAWRTYERHVNADAMAIRTPAGIDEAMYVKIGGIEQWVQIRGRDRRNPVLLCLHGGPGATWTPLTRLFLSWEKDFTVVQWDQRGAGKTLETTGPSIAATMSIDRMAQDGIELAEYLRQHLAKDRIILLGHSWGSILGMTMVQRRPDLFYAYVGTGQVSSMPHSQQLAYARMIENARASANERLRDELDKLGPPPYTRMEQVATHFDLLATLAPVSDREAEALLGRELLTAPNYSLIDVYYRAQGFARVPTWELYRSMLSTDLAAQATRFDVPIFFLQGALDAVTPESLAREYFQRIEAPRKEYVSFEGGGHFAVWRFADRFGRELVDRVRSLAQTTAH